MATQDSTSPAPSDDADTKNADAAGPGSQIRWIEADMRTAFANVVNVQSTREQFDLFFGTNQTWNPAQGGDVTVQLSNRVILSPFAAKRLIGVLSSVMTEYERRFGTIALAP